LRYAAEGANPLKLRGMDLVNFFGTESPHEERLQIFAAMIAILTVDFGQWDIPWGEVNRFQRLNGDIDLPFDDNAPSLPVAMASGRWGALASFGARQYPGTKRIYGSSGNSFVAVVEFGDKVKAKRKRRVCWPAARVVTQGLRTLMIRHNAMQTASLRMLRTTKRMSRGAP
jgi:hypothetical protein